MNRTRIALLALFCCIAYFVGRFVLDGPSDRAVHLSYTQAAGYGIGQLLARDFPAGGRVLYLVPAAQDEVLDTQFRPHADGMRAGFGKGGLEVLIEIGEGEKAPRRSELEMMGIVPRPLDDAAAVVGRNPDVIALVSLLTPAELPAAPELAKLPPLYVLDPTADPRWPDLLRRKLVKGVVTRNPEADLLPMEKGLQPAAEVFALRYKIVAP